MLRKVDSKDLIYYTVGSLLGLFILICIIYIIYKCLKRRKKEDETRLLDERLDENFDMRFGNLRISNDVDLVQKVNEETRKKVIESRESAYVYLRFFMRSNPSRIFLSIENLNNIGSQPETEKNWFLVKQLIKIETSEANKYRLIFINLIDPKSNPKIKKLVDIADSMSLNLKEMESLIDRFFKSIKHPHILPYDTVDVNFDKNRLLCVQDFSRDGSLRDHIKNTNPKDTWEIKNRVNSKNSLDLKTIKDYGKQILNGLIYLKENYLIPMDNLHAGNIILAYKKKVCLLTGYENSFFLTGTRTEKLNERFLEKIRKSYLIRVEDSETNEILIRKAKTEIEKKRIVEILRFGFLLVEMCVGQETFELIPNPDIIPKLKSFYNQRDFNELEAILNYIFFNRSGLDNENEKHKKKFLIPNFEQINSHNFFSSVKLKDQSKNQNILEPEHIEFLQYLNGKLEIKLKKLRRKSLLTLNNFSSKKRLSDLREPSFEMKEENPSNQSSNAPPPPPPNLLQTSVAPISSPPPPPPPPILSGPPPAPPHISLTAVSSSISGDSEDRSALLGDIRKGMKLKKAVTIDKSKPIF